jgi:hypothetical protein
MQSNTQRQESAVSGIRQSQRHFENAERPKQQNDRTSTTAGRVPVGGYLRVSTGTSIVFLSITV